MSAVQYDLYIEQGASFLRKLTFKDCDGNLVDLSSYTFRGQIRKYVSSPTIALSFTCTVLSQVTNKGELELSLTAEQTASLVLDQQTSPIRQAQEMCYDLEKVDGSTGFVERILEGLISVSPEVTR
jgi:hypothetical protein